MAGEDGDVTGSPPTHPDAERDEEGRWRLPTGEPLPVSASDLERYTYCPLSWHLAATGVAGESEAIEKGKKQHQACLLYTSPSPRDTDLSRMPSSA